MSVGGNLRGFQHLGLPVLNIDESKSWYSEHLGFEVIYETKLIEATEDINVAFLKLNDFVIEMYEISKYELEEIKSRQHGHIDHIAFDVDDIEEVSKKLNKSGFKTIEENPKFLPLWKNGVRFLTILGPNNEKIEFNQKNS